MLLRDEAQTALNEVEALCMASAEDFGAAAEQASEGDLAQQFAQLAQRRRALAAGLAPHIRALDDLPRQPDPDREAVDHVFQRIEAFLSGDTETTLIEHRLRGELQLQEALQTALKVELPEPTRDALDTLLDEVAQTRRWLEHAHQQK